jgi:threonine dehydrogenase-like Zn-dependent dehydrogenase
LCVILGLRASGAGCIVAVGRSSAGRRAAAAAVGADVVLDSRQTDVAQYVRDGGLVISQTYECSGDRQALMACQHSLRAGGTIVGVALGGTVDLDLHMFVGRGQRMVSACAYGNRDFQRALDLIASGVVDVRPLISERVPLCAAPDAFVRLRQPGELVSVLVQPGLRGKPRLTHTPGRA